VSRQGKNIQLAAGSRFAGRPTYRFAATRQIAFSFFDEILPPLRFDRTAGLIHFRITSTHTPITVCSLATADLPIAVKLLAQLGYSASTRAIASRIRKLGDADLLLLTKDDEGKGTGLIHAHALCPIEYGFTVEILALVVAATARRQGVGARLIRAAEQWARKLGAARLIVRSNVVRKESHQFYPALGYALAKTQRVYQKELR